METIYVDPENYGIDSGKLREMLEVLEKEAELHSISVKYEGKTILEGAWKPFTLEDPQMMHSPRRERRFVWVLPWMRES